MTTKKKTSVGNVIRGALLTAAIAILLALFSTSLVFSFIFEYTELSSGVLLLNGSPNESTNSECATAFYWREQPLVNQGEPCRHSDEYEFIADGICKDILLEWSYCITSNNDNTSVTTNVQFDTQDTLNQNILSFLQTFPECRQEILPFLCQYYFPLIDTAECKMYTAAREDCRRISSTAACATPWKLALSIGSLAEMVPKCDSLGTADHYDMNATVHDSNISTQLSCRDDFIPVNGSCVPHCEKFSINSRGYSIFIQACQVVVGLSSFTAFLIVAIYFIKEWKRIIQFPTVFTLFMLIDCGFSGITFSLPAFIGARPFCSSPNLYETIDSEPTPFCIFTGIIFHYTLMNLILWWFIHLTILAFRVAFPFRAQQMNGTNTLKCLYWALLVAGFLLPVPAVIVSLATEGGYNINGLPPHSCIPHSQIWFYSLLLPTNIFNGIGACLLIYIICSLNKLVREHIRV